jgi:DNA-binding response OmpR family regulator
MSGGLRILAIDHNPRNLELLRELLGVAGHEILGACSVAAVDEILASQPIDCALVDVAGLDATIWPRCQILRERGVPFLLLSARPSQALRDAAAAHGAESLLAKPLVLRQLVSWLHLVHKG